MTFDHSKHSLTHLSLFSGIGGMEIAAEAAGFFTVGQCEISDYPTKVLEKHWPDVQRWRDIRDLSRSNFIARTGCETVTVLSGGFPCQPHSVAGKRMASCDDRDLWPEMRRVISEIRPKWVVAENVPGILSSEHGRFFANILRDFAKMGFDVGWCTTSAAAVGAVHRRERVAIIAHDSSKRMEGRIEKKVCGEHQLSRIKMLRSVEEIGKRCAIFEPKLCRNFDGIRNGVDRIKCVGNSVMPLQFYIVFEAIADIERSKVQK